MNKQELMKQYLKQSGKRFKSDVYVQEAMSEAEIQQRIDALDIHDLDKTVQDDGSQVNETKKDDDKPVKKPFKPIDLGWGLTLIDEDSSNEYRG